MLLILHIETCDSKFDFGSYSNCLNYSDISINCTLWEDYAGKFLKFNNDRKEFGPVVVMLTYAKLKEEGDRKSVV